MLRSRFFQCSLFGQLLLYRFQQQQTVNAALLGNPPWIMRSCTSFSWSSKRSHVNSRMHVSSNGSKIRTLQAALHTHDPNQQEPSPQGIAGTITWKESTLHPTIQSSTRILIQSLKRCLPAWYTNANTDPMELSPYQAMVTVGTAAIIGEVLMRIRMSLLYFHDILKTSPVVFPFAPLLGSIMVCCLYFVRKDLHLGPETIYTDPIQEPTTHTKTPTFSLTRQLVRLLGVFITLASGCASAFTTPAAEVGMTLGRTVGRTCLQTESARRRLVLACAGAGMTTNFDTPLTSIFFAMDISQGSMKDLSGSSNASAMRKKADIIALFLASAVASFVCRRGCIGKGHPALNSISFTMGSCPLELGAFSLLGVLGALLNLYFERGRRIFTNLFSRIPLHTRPVLGGLACTVACLLGYPQSVFSGFEAMKKMAMGHISLSNPFSLFAFLVSRGFFVAFCGSTGLLGGSFAHAQFMGAALGGIMASILSVLSLMTPLSSASTYIVLGLAAMVTAMFRSPLTACILVLEFTKDMNLLIPLLVTTGTASLVSHRLL